MEFKRFGGRPLAALPEKKSLCVPRRIPALAGPLARPLRRSLSTSDLNKENIIRPGLKRLAVNPPSVRVPPKKKCPTPKKAPAATPASAPKKKIAPYDFKAKYNDLLERHKPMKAEYLELKRTQDELREETDDLRTQKENFDKTVEHYRTTIAEDAKEIARLKDELNEERHKHESARAEVAQLKDRLHSAETDLADTQSALLEATHKLTVYEQTNRENEQLISKQQDLIEDLQESTQKLHWERRSLHNKLQDMKGNIRVVFRVRPALAPGRSVANMNFPDACTIEMERFEPGATKRLAKHDFKFDRVFGPSSSQDDVWDEVSCLIQSALDGYHVCIFAYGQTGSGKTYTMEGTGDAPGVIPRCCTMLFDSIKQLTKSGWKYSVHASFLEIYNEQLYDLLEPGRDPRDFDIRMVDSKGSDVYVTNLSEQEVKSDMELLKLAARAQMHRQTAATAGNERSSRSHSVARIRLVGSHLAKEITLTSRICLVDLAGSESAKNTQRLKETKNINRSLSELGQVILALQQKQEHIPYRNSKLTRLLEPQLGGAAKALLIAAAAPYEECSHESLSTLRFATQVGHCSTASARRNLALAQPKSKSVEESL